MSWFADTLATTEVDLGPCQCPGTPHERDWIKVRAEFSGSEISALASVDEDDEAGVAATIARYVVEWSLLGPNGEPWPPGPDSLLALKQSALVSITNAISANVQDSARVPNSSSVRSVASSRASASRTPTTSPTPGT